jgi:hypothetical protein
VAPLAGAQIFTVLSTVAVQVCAEALFANVKRETSSRGAAKNPRSEITEGPPFRNKEFQICRYVRHWAGFPEPNSAQLRLYRPRVFLQDRRAAGRAGLSQPGRFGLQLQIDRFARYTASRTTAQPAGRLLRFGRFQQLAQFFPFVHGTFQICFRTIQQVCLALGLFNADEVL